MKHICSGCQKAIKENIFTRCTNNESRIITHYCEPCLEIKIKAEDEVIRVDTEMRRAVPDNQMPIPPKVPWMLENTFIEIERVSATSQIGILLILSWLSMFTALVYWIVA